MSSVEAQELLEKDSVEYNGPQQCGKWEAVRSNWWLVNTLLLLTILALLFERREHNISPARELTGDLSGFAPRFSQRITTLTPDPGFVPENVSEFWTDAVRHKWLSIVPRGLGYVHIQDPSVYNDLPTPIRDYSDMTVFTTSMPHQLHCLYNILAVYAALTGTNPHNIPTGMTFHLQHCFEYLRLNIMCCGDVALEGAETTFPDGFDGSDGWDSKHICKDYNQVLEYMDSRRANDTLWI